MMLIEHEARVGLPRKWEHPNPHPYQARRCRGEHGRRVYGDTAHQAAIRCGKQYSQAMRKPERGRKWLDEQMGDSE